MSKITIDNEEYETDDLSDEANAQIHSLVFVNNEITRLEAKTAALQTAKHAYSQALQDLLK